MFQYLWIFFLVIPYVVWSYISICRIINSKDTWEDAGDAPLNEVLWIVITIIIVFSIGISSLVEFLT